MRHRAWVRQEVKREARLQQALPRPSLVSRLRALLHRVV
jgi:hypothetical protein